MKRITFRRVVTAIAILTWRKWRWSLVPWIFLAIVGLLFAGQLRAIRRHDGNSPFMRMMAPGGRYEFFDNLRANGQFWVTDPLFGAKCDGSTNDATAIASSEVARAAAGGTLYFPPGMCITGTMLVPGSGTSWTGVPGQTTIRASSLMQAVAAFTGPVVIRGLIFDGNQAANHAVLRLSDANAVYELDQFSNAIVNGIRSAMSTGAATIGPVTQTGGGPTITVSQPDPYLAAFVPAHVYIKIALGGALGTATFNTSADNITYSSTPQTLFAHTIIGFMVGSTIETSWGLQLDAIAGAYILNTVYDFTFVNVLSTNNYAHFTSCQANNNGVAYGTGGFTTFLSSLRNVLATGTVATATGSQYVTGTGTHFLSYAGHLDGDGLLINTAAPISSAVNNSRFHVTAVLSDTLLVVDPLATPQFTVSGKDFIYASGAGFSEDVQAGNQLGSVLDHCTANNNATAGRFSGLSGPVLIQFTYHQFAVNGIDIGTACAD